MNDTKQKITYSGIYDTIWTTLIASIVELLLKNNPRLEHWTYEIYGMDCLRKS